MKYIIPLLLLGCAARGPNAMQVERVAPFADRLENRDVICYLIGVEKAFCKWKGSEQVFETDARFLVRKK